MSLGSNIKKLRDSLDFTQIEFGKLFGVSDKAVSTWENNIKVPNMGTIQKIADYFNLKKSDIIDGSLNFNINTKKPVLNENELSDIDKELISLMRQLTPEQALRVQDFVRGLLASR